MANSRQPIYFPSRVVVGRIHFRKGGLCKPMWTKIRSGDRLGRRDDIVTINPRIAVTLVDRELEQREQRPHKAASELFKSATYANV